MCGLLGYFFKGDHTFDLNYFKDDLKFLSKRGPDFSDYCAEQHNNVKFIFGHTRLSIIELSSLANQPYKDINNTLIFNGEIYNHNSLRCFFSKKNSYKSNSDTETLFYLLKHNNFFDVLNKIEGMFAFCFFDKQKNKIYLARDRVGEKPLYLYINNNIFGFSSDLSAFKNNKKNTLSLNLESVGDYMNLQYIPFPKTIYNECYKLPPGSFIEIDLNKYKFKKSNSFNNLINQNGIKFNKWWKLNFNKKIFNNNNYSQVKNKTEYLIKKSVKKQLISDVPLGAFLSSGVDSSLIVSLMQQITTNTQTFTIGYESKNLNEAVEAKKIAKHLSTNHTEFIFDSSDLLNLVEHIPTAYSEPFADSSQLPTLMVSKLASQKVKVVLSGDGGDEIFGGYNRYIIANKYWKYFKTLPVNIRQFFLTLVSYAPIGILNLFVKKYTNNNNIYKIIDKLKSIKNEKDYYLSMTNEWSNVNEILNFNYKINNQNKNNFDKNIPFEKNMMLEDFNSYLTDDILCKVDRASMFYSLETRAPFLDHELMEYCFSINNSFNFKNNNSKFILKDILKKYIPDKLISNKKKGFAIPISEWLNHDLREWSNDYLTKEMCKKHDLFNYDTIERIKFNDKNLSSSNYNKIWSIIQFNKWYSDIYE